MLGTVDPLLSGLSEEAARILDPAYEVNPSANYYFMVVSTFFIAAAGTWVTERVIAPRFGEYTGDEQPESLDALTAEEKRGLWFAAGALALIAPVLVLGTVPAKDFLRDPAAGCLPRRRAVRAIVARLS